MRGNYLMNEEIEKIEEYKIEKYINDLKESIKRLLIQVLLALLDYGEVLHLFHVQSLLL